MPAESYARGSIHHTVLPGLCRADLLTDPQILDRGRPAGREAWWRPVTVT